MKEKMWIVKELKKDKTNFKNKIDLGIYLKDKFELKLLDKEEIFVDIYGFEGNLKVSNRGRVWESGKFWTSGKNSRILKKTKQRIIKPCNNNKGYLFITTIINGLILNEYVHRLVAYHFCGTGENFHVVNHKDENTLNNNSSNLEWITHKENINYGNCINKISKSREKYVGELHPKYTYKEHYKTKPSIRSNFKKICKSKNWNFEDFEEVFTGKSQGKNRLYFYFEKEV